MKMSHSLQMDDRVIFIEASSLKISNTVHSMLIKDVTPPLIFAVKFYEYN